jgi:outer membrane receptor protein involved in Fe transport
MRFHVSSRILALVAVFGLVFPSVMLGQSLTQGAISGTVVDATNALLPNATVVLKNLDKGFTRDATSNAQGAFQFPLVDPGNYSVEVSENGFKKFTAKVAVNVGQSTIVNARLEIGPAGVTVEVSGVAPLMETEAADMSTTFDQNLVENMPNGGNDLTALAYTAPGVVMNSGGMYGNFTANGLGATSNLFTVDGENQMDPFMGLNNSGPTNLMLGKNSIEEATVVTNAYSGQYGQQAGAQVNLVSKGGTNEWHGNAQYEWTGRYLDANNWFNGGINGPPQGAPFTNNNEWAASFGGPIKKDKAFFFLDTEGIRYIVPSTGPVFAPTQAFLTDTLNNLNTIGASANTIATYTKAAQLWENAPHYTSGSPIANSCLDPVTGSSTPIGDGIGEAGGCFESYEASPAIPAKETLLIGRFDVNFTQKDHAFFRFDIDTGTQATYADPILTSSFSAASYQPSYNNGLTWNHTFGLTATNQFMAAISYYRATFNENTNGATSPFPYSLYVSADNIPNTNLFDLPGATGLNALNFNFPQGRDVTQYQFVDDFAKTYGRHNLKVGANFRRYDISNYDGQIEETPLVLAGLTSFYAGQADINVQTNPLHESAPMNTGGIGVYAQDEWSATSKLKLTFALRAEHNFNPTCDINCFTMPQAPFSQLVTQGVGTPYDQALNLNRNVAFNSVDTIDWGPRVGFTWSPFASSKTVLSGGIGIFYDAFPALITDSFVNVPYRISLTLGGPNVGGSSPVYWGDPNGAAAILQTTENVVRYGNSAAPSIGNGLTAQELVNAGGAVPSVTGYPGTQRTPQYSEWNVQVQQEIDSRSRITLAYVGNHGIHEPYPNSNLNAISASSITGFPSSNPDQRFGQFTEWNSGALSNHNGLTASYSRRTTAGFVINANFTWSHTLDEISNGALLPYNASSTQGQINPLNFRANNYGNADYDVRRSFNANYVWTEPFHLQNKFVNAFLGNWMVAENFNVRSGLPYTVGDGTVTTNDGGTAIPAEVLAPAQQSCSNGFSACFNSANFTSAGGLGYFPTQMRNQFRGPAYFGSDVTVGKGFNPTERMKVTIGLNVYNIFNHPNFQNPSSAWTGAGCSTIAAGSSQPSCGDITSTAAPPTGPYGSFFAGLPSGRIGQLTAKINF